MSILLPCLLALSNVLLAFQLVRKLRQMRAMQAHIADLQKVLHNNQKFLADLFECEEGLDRSKDGGDDGQSAYLH